MPCTSPNKVFRSVEKGSSGKHLLTINPLKAINSHVHFTIPCKKCMDCRIDRVTEWSTRLLHESQMHEHSVFATFTYDDDHLPDSYSVSKRECQLLFKRLRKAIHPCEVRYFISSEYGPETLRPHYHALIFGYPFRDREFHSKGKDGSPLFTSALLTKVWGMGQCLIGDVTAASAKYVAGYIIDKIGGDQAANHYTRISPKGLLVTVEPEFSLQSTKPGIGYKWLQKFKGDVFPSDFIVVDGRETRIPNYYFRKLAEEEQAALEKSRANSKWKNRKQIREKKSPARLKARAVITSERLKRRSSKL